MIWRTLLGLGAVAAIVGVVALCVWAVASSVEATVFCRSQGYPRGEAMVGGTIVCLEGKSFTGDAG